MKRCYLTFQEYFERLRTDAERWGKPFAALLGALDAQLGLGLAAIGGKDSMSGSFEDMDVPPTLVSLRRRPPDSVEQVVTAGVQGGPADRATACACTPRHACRLREATLAMFDEVEGLMRDGQGPRGLGRGRGRHSRGPVQDGLRQPPWALSSTRRFDAGALFRLDFGSFMLETDAGLRGRRD